MGDFSAWTGDSDFAEIVSKVDESGRWVKWWNNAHGQQSENWTVYGLIPGKGMRLENNCARCPKTMELLENIPNIRVAGFSRMQPHTDIKPHVGFTGKKYGCLAYHLGIVIPSEGEACLQVGPLLHHWTEVGQQVVFDDCYVHSAWNHTDETRIIFYIDFETDIWNEVAADVGLATVPNVPDGAGDVDNDDGGEGGSSGSGADDNAGNDDAGDGDNTAVAPIEAPM